MADSEQHFLDVLLAQIELGVQNYTQTAYEQLVIVLGPVFIALVSLYIIIQGIRLYLGRGDHTLLSYIRQTLTLGFIALLALNWNWFSRLVVDFVTRGPDELISGLIPNNNDEESVKGFFTQFFDESLAVFIEVFQSGGWRNFSAYIVGFIGGCAVLILIIAIFLLLVSAEVLLSVLLVLAPFIVPLYLFEASRAICLSWARMLVSTMFVPILVYAVSGLFTDILNTQLEIIKEDEIDYYNLASYLAIVVICTLLMREIPALASGLGGGITSLTVGPNNQAWANGVKKLYGGTKKTLGHYKQYKTEKAKQQLQQQKMANAETEESSTSSIILLSGSKLSGYGSTNAK